MQKLVIIALALITFQANAQERKRGNDRPDFTPEEMAQLQTKKMTLNLDLTEAQQRQISAINLENAKARKEKTKAFKNRKEGDKRPSKEEILKMKNDMLDKQIANKKKMKSILNAEQYDKWEKNQGRRHAMRGNKRMMKRKGKSGEHKRGERRQLREHKG